jgi:7-cyano-7-deazaguanine synthase
MSKKAVILCSGGLDSATVLAIAKSQGYECHAISVDYGQRNRAELDAARRVTEKLNATHKIVSVNLTSIGGSALTDDDIAVPDYKGDGKIPITYVPARNTIFLSIAMGYAETLECDDIFIGACQKDYSGYPDCRDVYLDAFQNLANLATKRAVEGNKMNIHAPLLNLTKAQTIQAGTKLDFDYSLTVTCYQADQTGRACGKCDSCTYRKQGFKEANLPDPTNYIS